MTTEPLSAAEAARWWLAHDAAAEAEDRARVGLLLAQESEARHDWRAAHPSELWPLADLEALAAHQNVVGAESRVGAAVETRRGAEWHLDRLGEWPDEQEEDDEAMTR